MVTYKLWLIIRSSIWMSKQKIIPWLCIAINYFFIYLRKLCLAWMSSKPTKLYTLQNISWWSDDMFFPRHIRWYLQCVYVPMKNRPTGCLWVWHRGTGKELFLSCSCLFSMTSNHLKILIKMMVLFYDVISWSIVFFCDKCWGQGTILNTKY